MKALALLLFALVVLQEDVPYKSNDEFEMKIDLQFKQRPAQDQNTVELDRRTLPNSGMKAPYIYLNLMVTKPDARETRVKVTNNKGQVLLSRKFDPSILIKLDLGFTDDLKDRVSAHHFVITFMTKDKVSTSKVEVFFEEDGTYLVNGEKRGRV